MGTRERRVREKDEVRRKILDAARVLFARDGYEAVSMRKIADAIEYSPTAIYVHFKDKADLMRELCRVDFENLSAGWGDMARVADPVERIRKLGLGYIRLACERPNHFRLVFMTKPTPELLDLTDEEARKRATGDANRGGYTLLKVAVMEGIERGRFRPELSDPDTLAQLLWAGVHGVATLHITRPDYDPGSPWIGARRLGKEMLDHLLRGVMNTPAARPAAKRTRAKGDKP